MREAITRDRVIHGFVQRALKHTELTRESFAEEVVYQYHQRTPLAQRRFEFHPFTSGCDFLAVMRANAQLVFRQLDGTTRLASELEEAVVLALPEPFRQACLTELAARYGLLAAALPATTAAGRVGQVGRMAKEFGEVLSAIGGALGEGQADTHDSAHNEAVVRELDDLIAPATTLRAAHARALPAAAPPAASAPTAPTIEKH